MRSNGTRSAFKDSRRIVILGGPEHLLIEVDGVHESREHLAPSIQR